MNEFFVCISETECRLNQSINQSISQSIFISGTWPIKSREDRKYLQQI